MKVKPIEAHRLSGYSFKICKSDPVRNLESLTNELAGALEIIKCNPLRDMLDSETMVCAASRALQKITDYNEGMK